MLSVNKAEMAENRAVTKAPKKKYSSMWDYFTLAEDKWFTLCTKYRLQIL